MTDLTAMLDTAREAQRREEAARALRDRKAAADSIRQVRQTAAREARERLGLATEPGDWHPPEDDELSRFGVVIYPITIDDYVEEELALAFRLRGYTEGGPSLTVVTRSDVEDLWVSSRITIDNLADLPDAVDDAIAAAEAYDEHLAGLEAGDAEDTGPARYVVEGDTLEEILARTIVELVGAWDTRDQ